jgi:hypothetical protein
MGETGSGSSVVGGEGVSDLRGAASTGRGVARSFTSTGADGVAGAARSEGAGAVSTVSGTDCVAGGNAACVHERKRLRQHRAIVIGKTKRALAQQRAGFAAHRKLKLTLEHRCHANRSPIH